MPLSETDRIDIVAKSPQGEIVLAMTAAGDWNNDSSMTGDLVKKLRTYHSFIKSEEFKQQHGNSPVYIQIMTNCELSPEADQLVQKVQKTTGIDIKTQVSG